MNDQIKSMVDLPTTFRFITIVTLFLAVLGLLLGLALFFLNLNLPSLEDFEHDTFEYFDLSIRHTLRFLGLLSTITGTFGLVGSILILKKNRIGWLILVGLHISGLIGCFYIIFRFIQFIVNYYQNPALLIVAIPSPLTFVIIWIIFVLFSLLNKPIINYFFKRNTFLQ